MKFSVIVPVYNVEEYLDECVLSVLNQSYEDFELILVDDGSPDNCPKMCDYYAENDSRIKVLHKDNGGSSSARNAGIELAEGEYIIFIDSDDFWSGNSVLKELNDIIGNTKSDVVVFRCFNWNTRTNTKTIDLPRYDYDVLDRFDINNSLHYLLSKKQLPGGAVSLTVNKKLIVENDIYFIEGIKAEDFDWILNVLLSSERIYATNSPFYVYRQSRDGSITTTADLKSIKDLMVTVSIWSKRSNNIESNIIKYDVKNYIAHIYCTAVLLINRIDSLAKKEAIKVLKPYNYVLKFGYWKRIQIIKLLIKLFGYSITAYLLDKYYHIKHR